MSRSESQRFLKDSVFAVLSLVAVTLVVVFFSFPRTPEAFLPVLALMVVPAVVLGVWARRSLVRYYKLPGEERERGSVTYRDLSKFGLWSAVGIVLGVALCSLTYLFTSSTLMVLAQVSIFLLCVARLFRVRFPIKSTEAPVPVAA
jgi:uncharacterized membrane protein YfcA